MVITGYAESIVHTVKESNSKIIRDEVSNCLKVPPDAYHAARQLLGFLSYSEHKKLLLPYYFRVFISKCGLRSKISAVSFLKR